MGKLRRRLRRDLLRTLKVSVGRRPLAGKAPPRERLAKLVFGLSYPRVTGKKDIRDNGVSNSAIQVLDRVFGCVR